MADADEREREEFERLRPAGADEPAELGREARHAERIEEGAVELRPRGVGEVLDLGLDLVRSRFGLCVALGALVWMPIQAVVVLMPPPEFAAIPGEDPWETIARAMRIGLGPNILASIGEILVVAMVARIIGDTIEGRRSGAGRALRTAVTRLPGLILIALVSFASMLVGFCAAVVPCLILIWVLAPAPYVYVIEGVGIRSAFRRSVRLSCGQLFSWPSFFAFWRLYGIMLVGLALVAPFTWLTVASAYPSVRAWMLETLHLSQPAYDALRIALGGLFLAASTAVRAAYLTAYYLDCRVRREGLDLEMWLHRIRPNVKGGEPA